MKFLLIAGSLLLATIHSYSQTVSGHDAAVTAAYGPTNYHLIGVYQGWDPNGVIIAGYNYYNNSSVSAVKRIYIGSIFHDLQNGYTGMGTQNPQAVLHLNSAGSSRNSISQYSGNLIVQGNSGGRSETLGASLEFVIPAYADGNNPFGQARIITVAGNTQNADATGKLILGTRRWFDKGTGSGADWNYGDDLVINGTGNVGVGTSQPDQKLTVNGTIHASKVVVDTQIPVPDYVFEKGYKLRSLKEVEAYIKANKHLPEVASAIEMKKKGVDVNELNMKLLQKVEELTLYLLKQNQRIDAQAYLINELKKNKIRLKHR